MGIHLFTQGADLQSFSWKHDVSSEFRRMCLLEWRDWLSVVKRKGEDGYFLIYTEAGLYADAIDFRTILQAAGELFLTRIGNQQHCSGVVLESFGYAT